MTHRGAARVAAGLAFLAALLPAGLLPAGPAAAQTVGAARLTGAFTMTGRITVSANVRGERPGQKLTRSWLFTPLCPSGPCATVFLARHRPHGRPLSVVLHSRSPGFYRGSSFFYAPLSCAGRVYPHGEVVPYTVAVHVSSRTTFLGILVVSGISATYTNDVRINRTPCVAFPGHDAAHYQGHPTPQ